MQPILRGRAVRPRRVLLYGTHGIGKSCWAAAAPRPIVLATEDGLDDIGVDRTPLLRETAEVGRWLIDLGGPDQHGYQTVVIDSLDWLEKLIWQATCKDEGKDTLEDFGYGKGYTKALRRWEKLITLLDGVRARGLNVVLLAHAKLEKFSPPDGEPYDRWNIDLHKLAAPLLQEWCDEVLFATYRVSTVTKEGGFNLQRTRAVGHGERIVYTSEAPTHAAKRRIALDDIMPLEWAAYQKSWPVASVQQPVASVASGDITGIVTDGHSKQKVKVENE